MKTILRFCICFTTLLASAQHLAKQEVFDAIATEYSGEAARRTRAGSLNTTAFRAAP